MVTIAKKSVTIVPEPEQQEEQSEPELEEEEPEPEEEEEPEPEPPTPRKPVRIRKNKIPELEPEPEPSPEPPKRRGRPMGSKSKEPGKPRAKRVKIVADEMEQTTLSPEEAQIQQSQRIPNDPNTMMFQLLTEHARTRSNRKSDLWKSWFNK